MASSDGAGGAAVGEAELTVLGMPARVGRWGFVAAGMLMNICLGTVYAWSVFRTPVAALFSTPAAPVTAKQTLMPFMLFLGVFTALMPVTGRFVGRFHPRTISLAGSLVVAAGWVLSGYATGVNHLMLTYGVLAGAGVGVVYGIPIAVVARWFPDHKGLAVGLTVLGFGMSALVTAPVAKALIGAYGVLKTFEVLGITFLGVLVMLSTVMRFPPAGWRPEGWHGPAAAADGDRDFTASAMVRTPAFLALWVCFLIGSVCGLMAIGISSDVAQEVVALDAATAAGLVSFFALFNGGGRPTFGWLTDAVGPRRAAVLSLLMIALASAGMLTAGKGDSAVYTAAFAAFWMGLGSWMAIAPTTTAAYFGLKNYAANYGVVFSAYGLGAIAAGLIAGNAKDLFGTYLHAFYVTGGLAALGVVIAATLLKPPAAAD